MSKVAEMRNSEPPPMYGALLMPLAPEWTEINPSVLFTSNSLQSLQEKTSSVPQVDERIKINKDARTKSTLGSSSGLWKYAIAS